MRNVPGVPRRERIRDLRAVFNSLPDREFALFQPGGERLTLHQLHHQIIRADVV